MGKQSWGNISVLNKANDNTVLSNFLSNSMETLVGKTCTMALGSHSLRKKGRSFSTFQLKNTSYENYEVK